MRVKLSNIKVDLNTTATNKRVTDIEHQICVHKDKSRACHHNIPLNHIPKVIKVSILMNCTLWINVLPPKGGVYTSVSSCTIFAGVNFDYNKHCQMQFGQYSQVDQENTPNNIQAAIIAGAICLSPSVNAIFVVFDTISNTESGTTSLCHQ